MGTALDKELSPSAKYIDKAERYLEEGKEASQKGWGISAQNFLLGSIAASLIALAKK